MGYRTSSSHYPASLLSVQNGKACTSQIKHMPGAERDQGGEAPRPSSARSSCSHGPRRKPTTVKSSPDHHRLSTLPLPPVPACQTSISRRAPDGVSRIRKGSSTTSVTGAPPCWLAR